MLNVYHSDSYYFYAFLSFCAVLYRIKHTSQPNKIKMKLLSHILLEEKNRLKEIKGPFISSLPNAINNNFLLLFGCAFHENIKRNWKKKNIWDLMDKFSFPYCFIFCSFLSYRVYMLLQCLARLQNFQFFLSFIFIGNSLWTQFMFILCTIYFNPSSILCVCVCSMTLRFPMRIKLNVNFY